MKLSKTFWIVVAVAVIILGGLYFMSMKSIQTEVYVPSNVGSNTSLVQTNTEQVKIVPVNAAPIITVSSSSKLGSYLVATNGMTLYAYAKDASNVSNCSGGCAINWPPYSPSASQSIASNNSMNGQLSIITRADGVKQFVYKGVPLYFWKNDTKIGDTTGQGVAGLWSVIKP